MTKAASTSNFVPRLASWGTPFAIGLLLACLAALPGLRTSSREATQQAIADTVAASATSLLIRNDQIALQTLCRDVAASDAIARVLIYDISGKLIAASREKKSPAKASARQSTGETVSAQLTAMDASAGTIEVIFVRNHLLANSRIALTGLAILALALLFLSFYVSESVQQWLSKRRDSLKASSDAFRSRLHRPASSRRGHSGKTSGEGVDEGSQANSHLESDDEDIFESDSASVDEGKVFAENLSENPVQASFQKEIFQGEGSAPLVSTCRIAWDRESARRELSPKLFSELESALRRRLLAIAQLYHAEFSGAGGAANDAEPAEGHIHCFKLRFTNPAESGEQLFSALCAMVLAQLACRSINGLPVRIELSVDRKNAETEDLDPSTPRSNFAKAIGGAALASGVMTIEAITLLKSDLGERLILSEAGLADGWVTLLGLKSPYDKLIESQAQMLAASLT